MIDADAEATPEAEAVGPALADRVMVTLTVVQLITVSVAIPSAFSVATAETTDEGEAVTEASTLEEAELAMSTEDVAEAEGMLLVETTSDGMGIVSPALPDSTADEVEAEAEVTAD